MQQSAALVAPPKVYADDGGLALVSASQITLYRECPRKWAYRYLLGIVTPTAPSAALGTEIDDTQLQPFLRDDRPFDFTRKSRSGDIAAALLPYLPKPKTAGLLVQKHFVMPSPTWRDGKHVGFGYQGFIDLWLPDSIAVPGLPGGAPFVGDFKSTSDVTAHWVKDEKALSTDVQAMLYATHALFETRAKAVDLAWMYTQTRNGLKARRTYLRVTPNQVAEQFGRINETALEMLAVRGANPDPSELEPNAGMCREYGGCPHISRCNLSPAQIIESLDKKKRRELGIVDTVEGNTKMAGGLLARLQAQKSGQQAGVTQPVPALVPSAAPPNAQPAASIPAPAPTPAPQPAPVVQPVATPEELAAHIAENPRAAFLTAAPVNPPESKLPPAPPVGTTQTTPTTATAEPAEAKRGPGRPRKGDKDPKGADAAMWTGLDRTQALQFAKALRAGCDAFITAMEAAS